MSSSERSGRRAAKAVAIAALALGLGFLAGQRLRPAPPVPVLAPNERLADTPAVLVAVRGLARLESVSFHMERIIDLENRQPRLFGLLEAKDAILLVAVGEVTAGIDLAKLRDGDVIADPVQRRISLRLPPPEILSVRLDNERTYAHERKTDALARRADDIETRARRIAESSIRGAALDSGILARAKESAEHTLTVLVRSLGYDRVQITWSEP